MLASRLAREGTAVGARLQRRRADWDRSYDDVCRAHPPFAVQSSRADLTWARACVDSRVFGLGASSWPLTSNAAAVASPGVDEGDGEDEESALIPFADMLNHGA